VEEAQARFRDELGRRDQLRAQEVQRLQIALQERARREKALEMELARIQGGRAGQVSGAAAAGGPEKAAAVVRGPEEPK
jgi:ParB family chromosome partitioning protein